MNSTQTYLTLNQTCIQKTRLIWGFLFLILSMPGCSSPTPISQSTVTSISRATTALPSNTSTPIPLTFTATPTQNESQTKTPQPPIKKTSAITSIPKTRNTVTKTPQRSATATERATLRPNEWKKLPIIPTIQPSSKVIILRGIELGNNPRAFSKIGDCGSTPAWFLGDFDRGEEFYDLGQHKYLEEIIEVFQGSYGRTSLAARSGFNASSLFVPIWTDRSKCESDETPLACEYRDHKPIVAFIMLGSNDVWHPEEFEPQMRKLIEFSIENGVIPILSTKADNEEGDGSINDTIARLAQEYEVPLWNYWLALEALPDRGLQEDNVHLTFGRNFFNDSEAMKKGWPVRNLTALQILNAVWLEIASLEE